MSSVHRTITIISAVIWLAAGDQIPIPTSVRVDNVSTPIHPFTVKAFQSPYPEGQELTGLSMSAQFGNLMLSDEPPSTSCYDDQDCLPGNETVIWVDAHGQAFMAYLLLPSNASC